MNQGSTQNHQAKNTKQRRTSTITSTTSPSTPVLLHPTSAPSQSNRPGPASPPSTTHTTRIKNIAFHSEETDRMDVPGASPQHEKLGIHASCLDDRQRQLKTYTSLASNHGSNGAATVSRRDQLRETADGGESGLSWRIKWETWE